MVVSGQFVDSLSGFPVAGVSVQIVDRFGKGTGIGVVGDEQGYFTISSDLLNDTSQNLLYASSASYKGQLVDPLVFAGADVVTMDRAYQDLPEAVVTPVKTMSQGGNGWIGWLVMGGLLLLLLSSSKRK